MNGPSHTARDRLGHTASGSFVVSLRVAVSLSLLEPARLCSPGLERRANRALVAGLRAARDLMDLVNRRDHIRASISESPMVSV